MNEGVWKAIQKYGLATVASVLFGYVLIVEVRAQQKEMIAQHVALVTEQKNLAQGILKLADKGGETQMLQEKILMVIRQMCVQAADTAADRRQCLKEQ